MPSAGECGRSTLRNHVKALGGELELIVTFPEGQIKKIKSLGIEPKS